MKQVDQILQGRWVIPIEPTGVFYEHHAIVIDQGRIVDILPTDQINGHYQAREVIDLPHHVILPGFVNTHTHSPMVLLKGLADDLPLMDWLNNHIWPAEAKWMHPEFIQDGTELAIAEMIRGGTTCFNEHYFFPEIIASVAKKTKIRACVGPTIIDFPTNWSQNEQDGFDRASALYHDLKSEPLIKMSLAPHAPYTTSDAILHKIKTFSDEHNLTVHMHVHETEQEVKDSLTKYGKRPLQRLHDIGLLSERFQCVHMTQINDEDIALLEKSGASVTHCPESNLKLASGYCPVDLLLQRCINVAIGTDGAASNNNLDMIGEMRTAALIGKTVAQSATAVPAHEALRMATLNGAKAMGLDHEIGSITVGKAADLIAIDLRHPTTQPLYNPISQLVYSAAHTQVSDVWVAGIPLMRNHLLKTLETTELNQITEKWQQRLG